MFILCLEHQQVNRRPAVWFDGGADRAEGDRPTVLQERDSAACWGEAHGIWHQQSWKLPDVNYENYFLKVVDKENGLPHETRKNLWKRWELALKQRTRRFFSSELVKWVSSASPPPLTLGEVIWVTLIRWYFDHTTCHNLSNHYSGSDGLWAVLTLDQHKTLTINPIWSVSGCWRDDAGESFNLRKLPRSVQPLHQQP